VADVHWLRAGVQAMAIWVAATLAVLAGFVVLTLAQGGHFHRTPTCGGLDANIYETAIHAAGFGLIALLAYWALGARRVRWRWARLAAVVAIGYLIVAAMVLGVGSFTAFCTGGPAR
jgi:peptidoglycan/LPS O-acetylase OafA/YrhL